MANSILKGILTFLVTFKPKVTGILRGTGILTYVKNSPPGLNSLLGGILNRKVVWGAKSPVGILSLRGILNIIVTIATNIWVDEHISKSLTLSGILSIRTSLDITEIMYYGVANP